APVADRADPNCRFENPMTRALRPRCYFARRIFRVTNAGFPVRAFSRMAIPAPLPTSRVSRYRRHAAAPIVLLAITLAVPLGGCSFDLGSWGSDNEKPKPVAQKSTDDISARSVSDAQGYATRGQVLAKSGKPEEALAEFDRAIALDP